MGALPRQRRQVSRGPHQFLINAASFSFCPLSVVFCPFYVVTPYRCETSAGSRRAERIRGEEVFDRGELPDALGRHGRGLTEDLILVRVAALGVSFGLLAFEARKMGTNFISGKHAPHFGDKSGKLPGNAGWLWAALAKFISFSPTT